jgi:uncharacterized membrane protein YraQ (UPF0718 family)
MSGFLYPRRWRFGQDISIGVSRLANRLGAWRAEWKFAALALIVFLGLLYLPIGSARVSGALGEAFLLAQWYAREHVILCLIPAFFIAGAIAVFVSQDSVVRYLGARANKVLAYGVASVSGSILAVCSCTVLPLFAGIYRRGAGLGPATTFLYSGPAINVLAIILTARVLGLELGIARAAGAIVFSIIIGISMQMIFRREEGERDDARLNLPATEGGRALWQDAVFFAALVGILVFANWGKPADPDGLWHTIHTIKWPLTGALAVLLAVILTTWFGLKWWWVVVASIPAVVLALIFPHQPAVAFTAGALGLAMLTGLQSGETGEWFASSWGFARQILPLLLVGVLVAGFLLGRPGEEGLIPATWVSRAVGGNSLAANLFASVAGAFMYFATLTEVPILQGLIGNGMGKGPALALLLAGPALSLPSMLVIHSVMGAKKTSVYVALVVVTATLSGFLYGFV